MKKILIIEDDPAIAAIEQDFLNISGYTAVIAVNGHDGLKEALDGDYSLVLLDLMLGDLDGFEVCRQIRKVSDIPVLMVTAKGDDADKIRGLGLDADDYIAKPFSPTELVARVRSKLAQYERIVKAVTPSQAVTLADVDEINIGPVRINSQTRRVYVNDAEIPCKHREYELLWFLMQNPDIVFTREQLYDQVWGVDAFGDMRLVGMYLSSLREKIETDPQNPVHIHTVRGAGYCFSSGR